MGNSTVHIKIICMGEPGVMNIGLRVNGKLDTFDVNENMWEKIFTVPAGSVVMCDARRTSGEQSVFMMAQMLVDDGIVDYMHRSDGEPVLVRYQVESAAA